MKEFIGFNGAINKAKAYKNIDYSKALSFIGIEVSDALKLIPTPQEEVQIEEVNRVYNI